MKRTVGIALIVLACVAVVAGVVHAQAGNPWEQPLTDISASMLGPVALAGFLIALAIGCLAAICGLGGYGIFVGIVIFGAILGNADSIASWLGIGG